MKTPKERQRAYRERRKEQKSAGLTKLKILTRAIAAKRLEILSEIAGSEPGAVFGQALDLLWTQRFGTTEPAVATPTVIAKPDKTMVEQTEKAGKAKPAKNKAAKADKPRKKVTKAKSEASGAEISAPA